MEQYPRYFDKWTYFYLKVSNEEEWSKYLQQKHDY